MKSSYTGENARKKAKNSLDNRRLKRYTFWEYRWVDAENSVCGTPRTIFCGTMQGGIARSLHCPISRATAD